MIDQSATHTDFSARNLNRFLVARGILTAARKAHWQPQGGFWKYPIYDLSGAILTYRCKAQPENTPKYWWAGQKPDDCHYYLLPGLQDAITHHNGLLYIASGEPDVLTFKSAGIDNVLCWFGETSVPPDLPAFLHELHVKHVTVYPDRDRTGHKAAQKIAAILHGSGIHFQAASLPDYLGDKGDINILWQHVGFDTTAFWDALANDTQPLEFELPEPTKRIPRPASTPAPDNETLYAAIEQALGIDSYKSNGWSRKAIPCPFNAHTHDDIRPAAYWHRDKHILQCFKCQQYYLAKEVAAVLSISKTPEPDHLPRPTLETPDLFHFPHGIPDSLRQTLIRLHHKTSIKDHTSALIVMELRQWAIAQKQLSPTDALSVTWLIDYANHIQWHTSEGVIRRGLKQLTALGFLKIHQHDPDGKGRPTDHYHPQPLTDALPRFHKVLSHRIRERIFRDKIPDTITPEWFTDPELIEQENERRQSLYDDYHDTRQRAEQRYMREVEKMRWRMSLEQLLLSRSTPLIEGEGLPCKNSRDYRALLYRAMIVAAGEGGRTITRANAADQLGVSGKTLSVLRFKAGIIADEQFETMEITSPENVVESVNQQFPWASRREFGKFLDNGTGDRKGLARSRPEDIDRWAKSEIDNDRTVTVYIQTASRERLATQEELASKARQYEARRERQRIQRSRSQSRPPSESDKVPSLLEELLAQAIEEACPRTFTTAYMMRQIALTPYRDEAELLAFLTSLDLISNLHPLIGDYTSRGGKNENKSPQSRRGRGKGVSHADTDFPEQASPGGG